MRPTKELQDSVDEFNHHCPVGTGVIYKHDDGSLTKTRTRSVAQILSGHSAVVWLEDFSGCVALSRIEQRLFNPRSQAAKQSPEDKGLGAAGAQLQGREPDAASQQPL